MTNTEACTLLVDAIRQVARARAEAESHRLVAHAAVHHAHALHVELARLREQHQRVVEEYRAYRAATIAIPERAA